MHVDRDTSSLRTAAIDSGGTTNVISISSNVWLITCHIKEHLWIKNGVKLFPTWLCVGFSSEKTPQITRSLHKTKSARVFCRHLVLTNISQKGHKNALKIPPSLKPRQLLKFGENRIPAQLRRAPRVLPRRSNSRASITDPLSRKLPAPASPTLA